MRLNKQEKAKPNFAGLTCPVQQAEMKLILAGKWPPLKPLPVFKYGTDEYRAEIYFDRTRGEWVCRKTSLPSNKVQELRGGLTEMTMALPRGPAEDFTEAVVAEQPEEESEGEANRRLQAILEWRESYGNGALYSELRDYLSESQQDEIHDCIRMSLTAWQLQFNPKNVAFVFDALCNGGGRLARLIEIAQQNKSEQKAGAQAQAKSVTHEAKRQVPVEAIHPIRDRRLRTRTTPTSLASVMFGETNGGFVLNVSETGMAVAVAELLTPGDFHSRIRIQLPNSRESIEISAQIAWLAESKKGAGIRFVDLAADARNQISNWIASENLSHESEHQLKLLRCENEPSEIRSHNSSGIFGNPSIRDEEATGPYPEIFPSEIIYPKLTAPADQINIQQSPLRNSVGTTSDAGLSMFGSVADTSTGDVLQGPEATFSPKLAEHLTPEPSETSIPQLSQDSTLEPADSVIPTTFENVPAEPMGSVSPAQVQSFSPGLIARKAPEASQVAPRGIPYTRHHALAGDLQEKAHGNTAAAGFGSRVRADKVESSADRLRGSTSHLYASEISAKRRFGFRLGAFVFLVVGFSIGFTVGLNTPTVPPETEEPSSESQSAQSPNARPENSAGVTKPTGQSSGVTTRSAVDSDNSSGVSKTDDETPSEEKHHENTKDSESFARAPSADSLSSPATEPRPSVNAGTSAAPNRPPGVIARKSPPPARPEPVHSLRAVRQMRAAMRHPAVRRVALATGAARHPLAASTILVTAPAEGSKSLRLTFPEKPIAASPAFAITSQVSVLVPPEPGPAVAHKPARLQAGELVSYVWPRYPRPRDRHVSPETVKVRATIGQHGELLDIKRVSGSISLFPDAMSAMRQWRYKPALFNKRPVKAQLDVTVEFRPPQYLARVSTQDPQHD